MIVRGLRVGRRSGVVSRGSDTWLANGKVGSADLLFSNEDTSNTAKYC